MPEIDVQSWLHNLARVVREKGDDVPKIAGRPTPSAVHLYRAAALYDQAARACTDADIEYDKAFPQEPASRGTETDR